MTFNRSAAGAMAERLAAQFLEQKFDYKILVRNYRTRFGEIDLIAEDAGILAFIEVRSRTTSEYGEALETINGAKRRRIARAAKQFLVQNRMEHRSCRFDVVTIQNRGEPQLLRDAFEINE